MRDSFGFRIYAAAFLMDLAFGMASALMPWMAAGRFHAADDMIGVIASGGTLFYTAMALSAGRLARVAPARIRSLVGAAIAAMAYLATSRADVLTWLLAGTWASSVGLSFYWPAVQSRLSEGCSRADVARRVAFFNVSWSAGMMLGPLAAGYLFHVSPGVAYLAAGAAAVLAGLALPWRRARPALERESETGSAPEAGRLPAPTEQKTGLVTPAQGGAPWLLYGAWLANFGSYFSAAAVRNFFAHLGASQGVSVPSQGLLLFSMGVFQSLTFFVLSREPRWTRHPLALPVFMVVAGAAVVAIVPALPLALRIIPFAVAGIGFGGTYSLSLYRSVQSANPAAAVGIHEGVIGAGVVCGAVVGGLAGRHIGLDAPFILGGCVSGVLLIPLMLLLREPGSMQ